MSKDKNIKHTGYVAKHFVSALLYGHEVGLGKEEAEKLKAWRAKIEGTPNANEKFVWSSDDSPEYTPKVCEVLKTTADCAGVQLSVVTIK